MATSEPFSKNSFFIFCSKSRKNRRLVTLLTSTKIFDFIKFRGNRSFYELNTDSGLERGFSLTVWQHVLGPGKLFRHIKLTIVLNFYIGLKFLADFRPPIFTGFGKNMKIEFLENGFDGVKNLVLTP